jgi:thiol-disulfide isomerase/thioredoxin
VAEGPGYHWGGVTLTSADALRVSLKTLACLAIVYLAATASLFALMRRSNTVAGKALSLLPGPAFMVLPLETLWCEARKGALEVGGEAPDFDLPTRDGASRVRLSSLRQARPVVLVFGSYTCPPFRREMPAVNKVYRDYKDRVAFYFVYLEEAHAHDVWALAINAKERTDYGTAKDLSERSSVANTCASAMRIEFPILVDDMDNSVGRAYTAWPTRLYVVDRDGKLAFKSRPGPFGFEALALRRALARLTPPTSPGSPVL